MTTPVLSVVIPTRNRREILMATLRVLAKERGIEGGLEVIVADDGSTDGSVNLVRASVFESFSLRVLTLEAGGPARARNRAIAEASADRILLLGDDTIPVPNAISAHLMLGKDRDVAVQGRIDWDRKRDITDTMAFLAPEGPQFWFRGLKDGEPVPWPQILGSNLSAPAHWFRTEAYDERFSDACMEDTELAWRWKKRGWTTVWSELARCYHYHRYETIEPFLERQRRAGRWARLAVRKNPGMIFKVAIEPLITLPWKTAATGVRKLTGRGKKEDVWDLQCRTAFLRGFLS